MKSKSRKKSQNDKINRSEQKLRIQTQEIDSEQKNLIGQRYTTNENKKITLDYVDQQVFFQSKICLIFIKIFQIIAVLFLLLFIVGMSFSILNQIKQFWISQKIQQQSDNKYNTHLLKNVQNQGQNVQKIEIHQNKQPYEENIQLDKQSKDQFQQIKVFKKQFDISNLNQIVSRVQSQINHNLIAQANKQISNAKQQKPQPIRLPKKQTNIQIQKLQKKYSYNQDQKNIFQHTQLPNVPQSELYDPILIQISKMRKRYGPNYKQTIYSVLKSDISLDQYKRAKNLIEIMNYYNPKTKKFNVQQIITERKNNQKYYKTNLIQEENKKYSINKGPQQVIQTANDQNKQIEDSPQIYKSAQNSNCLISGISCQQKQTQIQQIINQQKVYFRQKYNKPFQQLSTTDKQLPFCIVIPSYKNIKNQNYKKNINSILQQQYQNFHIIYIDDASKDGSAQAVRQYIKKYQISEEKMMFIENQQNKKALTNIYNAAHNYCREKEIMIIVDGDDYLIGTQVFRFLNFQYQTEKLLASYTNYLRINSPYYLKVGTSASYSKIILEKRLFRNYATLFKASHLRSYYVDLFRKIKPKDLKDEKGNFFSAANDFAIMMPILQMASPHIKYLPQLTYLYDSGTGLNNFKSKKQMQHNNVNLISRRKKYQQVELKDFYSQS